MTLNHLTLLDSHSVLQASFEAEASLELQIHLLLTPSTAIINASTSTRLNLDLIIKTAIVIQTVMVVNFVSKLFSSVY